MATRGCESAPASRLTALKSRIESRTAGTRCPNNCTSWSARTPRCQPSLGRCMTRPGARSVCPACYRPTPRFARRRPGCRRCPGRRPSQRRSRMLRIARPRNGQRRRSLWRASGTRPAPGHSRGLGMSRCTRHPRTRSSCRTRSRHTVEHPRFAGTRAPAGAGQRRQANRTESCRHVRSIGDAIVGRTFPARLARAGAVGVSGHGISNTALEVGVLDSPPRATRGAESHRCTRMPTPTDVSFAQTEEESYVLCELRPTHSGRSRTVSIVWCYPGVQRGAVGCPACPISSSAHCRSS
jgi:hypothetical protein